MLTHRIYKRSKWVSLEGLNHAFKPLQTSIISLFVIRYYSAEMWGEFVGFLILVELIHNLLSWGQKPYLTKVFAKSPGQISNLWFNSVYARASLLVISVLIVGFVPVLREYFFVLSFWIFSKWAASMFESLIQFNRKYLISILAEFIALTLALAIIFWFKDSLNVELLLVIFGASSFAKFLVLIPLAPRQEFRGFNAGKVKTELALGLPFFALSITGLIQSKSDLYIVTLMLDTAQIARYQILIGFLVLGQTFSILALNPFLKNIYRMNKEGLRNLKATYVKLGTGFTLFFILLVYVVLKYIYLIELSITELTLIFFYLIPLFIYLIESQRLIRNNRENCFLRYTIYAGVLNIGLSVILVYYLGIPGALAAGIISRVLLTVLVVNESNKIE